MAKNPINLDKTELSDEDRKRIQKEVGYAVAVAQAARSLEEPKSAMDKIGSSLCKILTSSAGLLVLGSILTGLLVPHIQQLAESRKQEAVLLQQLLEQFYKYSNTILEEYYTILPLATEENLSKEQYNAYLQKILQIQSKRIDAYAKVEALAVNFNDTNPQNNHNTQKSLDIAIKNYSVKIDEASQSINNLLSNFYKKSDGDPSQNRFTPAGYIKNTIRPNLLTVLNKDQEPITLLINQKVYEAKHPNLFDFKLFNIQLIIK